MTMEAGLVSVVLAAISKESAAAASALRVTVSPWATFNTRLPPAGMVLLPVATALDGVQEARFTVPEPVPALVMVRVRLSSNRAVLDWVPAMEMLAGSVRVLLAEMNRESAAAEIVLRTTVSFWATFKVRLPPAGMFLEPALSALEGEHEARLTVPEPEPLLLIVRVRFASNLAVLLWLAAPITIVSDGMTRVVAEVIKIELPLAIRLLRITVSFWATFKVRTLLARIFFTPVLTAFDGVQEATFTVPAPEPPTLLMVMVRCSSNVAVLLSSAAPMTMVAGLARVVLAVMSMEPPLAVRLFKTTVSPWATFKVSVAPAKRFLTPVVAAPEGEQDATFTVPEPEPEFVIVIRRLSSNLAIRVSFESTVRVVAPEAERVLPVAINKESAAALTALNTMVSWSATFKARLPLAGML